MKFIKCDFSSEISDVERSEVEDIFKKLHSEIDRIKNSKKKGYATEYSSLNLPADQKEIIQVKQMIEKKKKKLDPKTVVVIGIGGSNLGTIAVHEAVNGLLYNEFGPEIKIYFVDSVDADYTTSVLRLVERELKEKRNVLVNVVTKSGTTIETIVNFELFLALLKKYNPEKYTQQIVATTDKNSKLWQWAQQEGVETLEVPEKVGGRYSVLSPVGLFPLGLIGVDIEQLCAGAQVMLEPSLEKNLDKNFAACSAATIFAQIQKGFSIHDTFLFSKNLCAVGNWYRQLVAESLGKKVDREGNVVHAGITPTTSVGTNDLHSVFQLYLGGPRDKFTTFVTVEKTNDLRVPNFKEFDEFVANVQGKTFHEINSAIQMGVKRAYQNDERPFVSISLPEKNEFYLGQFLQMKMIEVMYLGFLMNVNPFDQPQVELYKKETRKLLA